MNKFESKAKIVGNITFPNFKNIRVMMMPFYLYDLDMWTKIPSAYFAGRTSSGGTHQTKNLILSDNKTFCYKIGISTPPLDKYIPCNPVHDTG